MTTNKRNARASVYEIQYALQMLSHLDRTRPTVMPDGIYGAETTRAVRVHQSKNALPQTGVVDRATWDSIFAQYALAKPYYQQPAAITPFRDPPLLLQAGRAGAGIGMAQIMLWELSRHYSNIKPPALTLTLDNATLTALHVVQALSGLPMQSVLDGPTWGALTNLFNAVGAGAL